MVWWLGMATALALKATLSVGITRDGGLRKGGRYVETLGGGINYGQNETQRYGVAKQMASLSIMALMS